MKLPDLKTIAGLCLLFFAFAVAQPAHAQDKADMLKNSTPEQRAKMQTGMMKTKLQLDTTQVVKVQAINLAAAQKMDPILKSDGGKLAKLRQMRDIENTRDKELKKVLTDDQYKKYEAAKEEMKEKMKERMQDYKNSKS
ncbi:hypothetical protein BEL04_03430 [Mucilaginibacter sp. PPCGB 2223]|uniref:hypothetical protein n=1 Tax=Mucilaginibacter sp. PPCGB 2223 TaxID=1886027 RepID=UPI000824B2C7|nr:hypothetical protein [Mucilaginibacter sp. PPCGB 2223]OCX53365.1 hypothetical protein BEL04_03430 [Mucilaginibacter sp. PPCGB 2223]